MDIVGIEVDAETFVSLGGPPDETVLPGVLIAPERLELQAHKLMKNLSRVPINYINTRLPDEKPKVTVREEDERATNNTNLSRVLIGYQLRKGKRKGHA